MTSTDRALRGANVTQLMSTAQEARHQFVDVIDDHLHFDIDGTIATTSTPMLGGAPTRRAHGQLAGRAGVPQAFYHRLVDGHPGLWQHTMRELYPTGPSLVRMIRSDQPGGTWITKPTVRAVLSDRYQIIDNVDVLTTMLGAFTESGLGANEVQIHGDFDADDGLLRIRCTVPSIAVHARDLVATYRSPFDHRTGAELPMIFAGIEVSNSETGGGAFTIRPRAVLQVCNNGMTRDIATEQFRRVHLGAKLDQSGVIVWSDETRRKQLELVSSAARDAITTFVSPSYLTGIVNEASAAAGIQVTNIDEARARLVKSAQLSDDESNAVMRMWMDSADSSVLGLAHAVTAAAQLAESSDRQSELEQTFWSIVSQPDVYAVG